MALSAVGILVLLAVVGLAVFISRKSPKVNAFFTGIKNTLFWNFLIRYFQASFIGFNFAALTVVQKSGGGFKDISSSVIILIIQYGIVCLIAYILLKKDPRELNKLPTRKKIGNLYFNLDARKRYKLLYGLSFFVQRCILVVILAIKYDFGI